jgi:ATP-dependent Lon protease
VFDALAPALPFLPSRIMSFPDNLQFDPNSFSGVARLFPLPNLVLFPHVLQPLHIFEPRYCDLLEAALADDRLIAMAVLAPGWEQEYEGRPPVYPMACLGRVATHVRLPNNRHNLLLAGVARLRLGQELPVSTSYRSVPATLCADSYPPTPAAASDSLRQKLLAEFRAALPKTKEAQGLMAQFLQSDIGLGALTDIVAYHMEINAAAKMDLLAECDVHARATRLLAEFAGRTSRLQSLFPPNFSAN